MSFLFFFIPQVIVFLSQLLFAKGQYAFSFNANVFIPFVLVAIFVTFIQILSEEVLFRAYLLQMFGLVFKNKYIILLLVTLAFAFAHVSNAAFSTSYFVYLLISVLITYNVIKYNTLEYAIGIHFANNLVALTLISSINTDFKTPSIFVVKPFENQFFDIFAYALVWIAYEFLLRKYLKKKSR